MTLRAKVSINPAASAASALIKDLQVRFVWEQHPTYTTSALHLRILTRAGWASINAAPCKDFVRLFVRFDTPSLSRLCGLDSNENTGKWNHTLPADDKAIVEQTGWLFGPLEVGHATAEAEFFAAVQVMLSKAEQREWSHWDGLSVEQKERANNRKSLPVRRTCGALSTDRATSHPWCSHCGTDYSGQSAQQFLTAAGGFILGLPNYSRVAQ